MPVEVNNWTRMLPGVGAYNAIARIINGIKHQNPDGSPKIGNLPVSGTVPTSQIINPVTDQPYGLSPNLNHVPMSSARTAGSGGGWNFGNVFGGGRQLTQTRDAQGRTMIYGYTDRMNQLGQAGAADYLSSVTSGSRDPMLARQQL